MVVFYVYNTIVARFEEQINQQIDIFSVESNFYATFPLL